MGHLQLTQQREDVFDESLASLCPVRRKCGAGLVKFLAALCFARQRLLMGFFQPLQGLHLFRQSLQEFGEGFWAGHWGSDFTASTFWGLGPEALADLGVAGGDSRLHSARSSSASRASHAARVPSAPAKTVPVH